MWCDIFVLVSLALTLIAEVWSRVREMEGINTSKLRPPLDHRWHVRYVRGHSDRLACRRPVLMVACLYWLTIGTIEVTYILTTKQLNDKGLEVDWVW